MSNQKKSEVEYKRYYRANELAVLLGIGLSTVWLYAKNKRITPIKLSPRVTVFDISEVNENLVNLNTHTA